MDHADVRGKSAGETLHTGIIMGETRQKHAKPLKPTMSRVVLIGRFLALISSTPQEWPTWSFHINKIESVRVRCSALQSNVLCWGV